MLYRQVNIAAINGKLPPEAVTSADIESRLKPVYERLKLPEGRLELMTGIRERRFWAPGTLPSEAASLAGEAALEASGIPREKIGCLLMCSVSRDFLEPATATVVHNRLGLPSRAEVFDVSNACLGFLSGMIVLGNMIELGQVEAGLLVSGENSRPLLESTIEKILNDETLTRRTVKPLFASLTIGSGAVAAVLAKRGLTGSGHRLLGGVSLAATEHNDLCRGGNPASGMTDGSETLMNTDSEMLMQCGVEAAAKTWKLFLSETGLSESDFSCYCTHQVGRAHKKLLCEKLGIDIGKDFATLETMGNVGSVSCPVTLAAAVESGALKEGETAAMLGIGSGINCTMLGVKW